MVVTWRDFYTWTGTLDYSSELCVKKRTARPDAASPVLDVEISPWIRTGIWFSDTTCPPSEEFLYTMRILWVFVLCFIHLSGKRQLHLRSDVKRSKYVIDILFLINVLNIYEITVSISFRCHIHSRYWRLVEVMLGFVKLWRPSEYRAVVLWGKKELIHVSWYCSVDLGLKYQREGETDIIDFDTVVRVSTFLEAFFSLFGTWINIMNNGWLNHSLRCQYKDAVIWFVKYIDNRPTCNCGLISTWGRDIKDFSVVVWHFTHI